MTSDSEQNERLLATIANYCIQIYQNEQSIVAYLVGLLAQSSLELAIIEDSYDGAYELYVLWCPPELHLILDQHKHKLHSKIDNAIRAVLPRNYTHRVSLVEYDVNWRMRLVAESETTPVNNQNNFGITKPIMYTGMKFNSPPEVEIAKALERKGIMYLANCLVRVGTSNNRSSIYPDFLIFHNNKIGWLEVDGQTYHTPRNATQDHARSRAVEIHGGIDYFTRYDANKCRNDPDGVVEEFLKILNKK